MIAVDNIRPIAQELLHKTRSHQLRWRPDATNDTGCALFFPTSHVRVSGWDEGEPPQHRLAFEDEHWNVVGEWIVHPNEDGWELLHQLYTAAWDNRKHEKKPFPEQRPERVLRDIQAALSSV